VVLSTVSICAARASKISLAIALVFAMQAPARADSYTMTGNQLLTFCEGQNSFSQGVCQGYVLGVADHYLTNGIDEILRICIVSRVTRKQVVDVAVAFLQSRPEKRQYIAEGVVWEALHDAFPCKSN
jgi:hypothetical protein